MDVRCPHSFHSPSKNFCTNIDTRFWNYAGIGQDPISSYGTASNNFMRTVRTKYDPNGVFKTLVAGGFKLS